MEICLFFEGMKSPAALIVIVASDKSAAVVYISNNNNINNDGKNSHRPTTTGFVWRNENIIRNRAISFTSIAITVSNA